MKAIYKKRLLKLADLLLADAKNKKGIKFDLGCVVRSDYDPATDKWAPITVSCGTMACAMGLAAISDTFKREGVRWHQQARDIKTSMKVKTSRGHKMVYGWHDVARHLFGLHTYEVNWLFTTDGYNDENLPTSEAAGERAVAKRIKALANGKKFAPLFDDCGNAMQGRFAPAHA